MVLFIKAAGSHAEMGEQEGTQLREKIHAALEEVFHSDVMMQAKPKGVPLGIVKWALGLIAKRNTAKPIQLLLPHQFAKMQGIAKGSGQKMGIIYAAQFIETYFGNPKTSYVTPPSQGCSQLFALPEATTDESLFFARNFDFPNILQPIQVVREESPSDGFRTLTMSLFVMAGAHMGLNEKGLAIGVNYGRSWKKNPLDYRFTGVPSLLILQEILETCETVEKVIQFVTKFPARAHGFHFGVVDETGDACVIETTATRHAIRRPDGGIMAHTNHYQTPELTDANVPDDILWQFKGFQVPYIQSPRERYEREIEMLDQARGHITIDTLKTILRDHRGGEGTDFTPCVHGPVGSTLASNIIKPRTRQMWVTDTQPCLMEYEEFTLS
ncbi:MAG TPA: C45 family peptidase [Candidatus Lokiarchaeia archaeon]|nr:C45 family peptidase [Candidatus Lokiarchaeia archaeon]